MKVLQSKPQVNKKKFVYYDMYYTVIKNRDDEEIVKHEYETDEIDYNTFDDFITPNRYIGNKNDNDILRWRKIRS